MEVNGYDLALEPLVGKSSGMLPVDQALQALFKQTVVDQVSRQVVVKAGDTVSELAVQHHTSVTAIVQNNHLQNPDMILIGQKLRIKSDDVEGPSVIDSSMIAKASAAQSQINGQDLGTQVSQFAKQFLGDAYVWGSAKPGAFDCSGLVSYAYQRFGVQLPHLAQAQAEQTQRITTKAAQPGDLLFWQNQQGHVYHVGIALEGGHYINALDPAHGVQVDGMATPATFAGRVINKH
ncbi:LysM peptidoglycan-binding domain-containing C40 family peptidase [Periweissella fabaria]|uniref:Uncharacterized protein n=1 Tax=Periweissella fabaria TaxID=546157 RepID=A0ABM8Z684_9LACO|nr:LysM peptidoglycan-binding domain-containing C40 family peptidase [Periweissella fabaria]MCM0596961.1 LysM peptidoglycan-binding domain-containing C40 family peptidase [Periweissella fabaria]CAH0416916.1 hypothetical protein WFA24289_01232 [Periweissella fabaria]